ncbi:MAG: glycosyltransferase [Nitrospirae bacterium]|nr:glycosyltransferase [Nitrospirota bacterium]
MGRKISVIIPNFNGSATIGRCLEAVFDSRYDDFEVIVVDDCSTDNSAEITGLFPCRLIRLDRHAGASRARNVGALSSSGEILFFMDADCVMQADTLAAVERAFTEHDRTIIGGTYTRLPHDDRFYSAFQSVFIHYSETRKEEPDYIASHAMVISPGIFRESGGFPEDFLPILEDVEFSHRLRRSGMKLRMDPSILVRHIFNFTLHKSLRNAFRKSLYWSMYSLKNRDLLADSGTASLELKTNVVSFAVMMLLLSLALISGKAVLSFPVPFILVFNILVNRHFFSAIYETKGMVFLVSSVLYYTLIYPFAVGAGSFMGISRFYLGSSGSRDIR